MPHFAARHPDGVIIDISRKRVLLDGEPAGLTYKEFELLQYLVLREGRTIDRHELIDGLWAGEDDVPNERTIDVNCAIVREDFGICEAAQGNLQAGIYDRGPLSPRQEDGVRYFHALLRQSLGDNALG